MLHRLRPPMAVISRNIYGERYGALRRLEDTGAMHEIEPLGRVELELTTEFSVPG
jgi:hypothetical protein